MNITFYKLSVSILLVLSMLFVFFFLAVPVYADGEQKESVKENKEVVKDPDPEDPEDPVDVPCNKYLDGQWFDDWDKYYDYLIEHYAVERLTKAAPTSLVGTTWIFNSAMSDNWYDSSNRPYLSAGGSNYFHFGNYDCNSLNYNGSLDKITYYYDYAERTVYNAGWFNNSYRNISFRANPSYIYAMPTSSGPQNSSNALTLSQYISWIYDNAVQVVPPVVSYISVTNGSFSISDGSNSSSSSPFQADSGSDLTITVTPNSGYGFPDDLEILGSYGTYTNSGNGVYTITNVTSDLTITADCPSAVQYSTVTCSITNGTGGIFDGTSSSSTSLNVVNGSNINFNISPSSGYDYPSSITVSGEQGVQYQSITYLGVTSGTARWQISNIQGNISVSATCPAIVLPTYYTVTYSFTNCSTSAPTSIIENGNLSGTIVPNSGYLLPTSVTGQSAGLPITVTYDSSTGAFSVSNVTGDTTLYATAISQSADNSITYDLVGCTCSISNTTVAYGSTLTFYLTPNPGYLMVTDETRVGVLGSYEVNYPVPNSYNYYYSFTVTGDVVITGKAVPYQTALRSAYDNGYFDGGNGSTGSYRDGYNNGYVAGQGSVSAASSDLIGLNRYQSIYTDGYNSALADVLNYSGIEAQYVSDAISNSAFADGVYSVTPSASAGSDSLSQYNLIFTSGVASVSPSAPVGSLSYQTYYDIYNMGYTVGENSVTAEGVSQSLTGFIPSVIASIGGGLLYTGEHITVFGITLASIFGLVILVAVGLWLFKLFKGAL